MLHHATIDTLLGTFHTISNHEALFYLSFSTPSTQSALIQRLRKVAQQNLSKGDTLVNQQVIRELNAYYRGRLKQFTLPIHLVGTPFQEHVWKILRQIPYGQTRSYHEIAIQLGRPTAYRAVAQANRRNPIAIIVPCHRVINKNGKLGGYAGGIHCKQTLLDLEEAHTSTRLSPNS